MFGKIFTQIFDSSLADNPQTRWIFMDMLVLADQNGVVDMTREAISRRTNVPLDSVCVAIQELESRDGRSRSNDFGGVRIKRLDNHRDWGWVIVNYSKYRSIANAETYREVNRQKVALVRASAKAEADSKAEAQAEDKTQIITSNYKFAKPEQSEMETYAIRIGMPVLEINNFYDYYESNGWKVGKNSMKSWQSSMRRWNRTSKSFGASSGSRPPGGNF